VLDLASNAGFWSLAAIEAGCDYVLGVDGRQMHVDQASLVFEAKEVDPGRYDFRLGDVFALGPAEIGTFDLVLCLGLMYHVDHPVGLVRVVAACSSDLAVIDTQLTERSGSVFELRREDVESPRNALHEESILVPSRQAVVDLAERFGFAVQVLEPAFSSYRGARDYQAGLRRAFLCSKRTPLPPG
jgi:SAM-dependent methyltransferase